MKKRCQEIGCNKIATNYYNDKRVCKNHACRCSSISKSDDWFGGCLLHPNKKKNSKKLKAKLK